MAIEKVTTDPVTTGLDGYDANAVVEYEDKFFVHREQGNTEWTPLGTVGRTTQDERGRQIDRLLRRLDPKGTSSWRIRQKRFPVSADANTYSFVTNNAAAAGAANTVPVTYDPAYVYLSTTQTSGGLCMLSTTAGSTTAVALSAGTADSGVAMTIKFGTTAAGSTATVAAGATALSVAGVNNNTCTAYFGFGVDGATSTTKFCVISDATTAGKAATSQAIDGAWHDVELIRKDGLLTCYVDGTSVGTYAAGGTYLSTAAAPIGALISTAGSYNANMSLGAITVAVAAKTGA